jgi:glycosyltransferase involved in cell wall biosynthesis
MKLCIVTPTVVKGDGQGRANYEITKEAIRRGYHVTLLARRVAPELQEDKQINWINLSVEQMPTQFFKEMVFYWRSTNWLRKHRQKFDLIQVYGAVTGAKGDVNTAQFVHAACLRSPVHISRVRRNVYGAYQWFYTVWNAYLERKAFQQAEVAIAVSERVKAELVSIGIIEQSIRVIFNGVDLQEFCPGFTDRGTLGLPEKEVLAFFAGDIHTNRKNLDTVLNALVKVPELHLVVVGTAEGTPYPRLVRSLRLEQRVHFLGYRRDVPQLMRTADLFVFPSRYEPFGLVVIEAMASGVPVVTTVTTGASEIVTPECGVVLKDSEDVEGLAEVLKNLTSDRPKLQQMGQAARAIAEQHSWASKAKSYVDLFEEMSLPQS